MKLTWSLVPGILDRSSKGQHLGSEAVRRTIEKRLPKLVVCGHVHESNGKTDKSGSTTIVNAGSSGIIYELEK